MSDDTEYQIRRMLEEIDRENAERRCWTTQCITVLLVAGFIVALGAAIIVIVALISALIGAL